LGDFVSKRHFLEALLRLNASDFGEKSRSQVINGSEKNPNGDILNSWIYESKK
jgi:hypothetical protein